jgi:hypothetical protein
VGTHPASALSALARGVAAAVRRGGHVGVEDCGAAIRHTMNVGTGHIRRGVWVRVWWIRDDRLLGIQELRRLYRGTGLEIGALELRHTGPPLSELGPASGDLHSCWLL